MRTIIGAILAVVVLGEASLYARLGESPAQIRARYGSVLKRMDQGTNFWLGAYEFKNYRIMVSYMDNKSVGEMIVPKSGGKLGEFEVDALMKNVGGDDPWTKTVASKMTLSTWRNTKTKSEAWWEHGIAEADNLSVVSVELIGRLNADSKKEEKDKAAGF